VVGDLDGVAGGVIEQEDAALDSQHSVHRYLRVGGAGGGRLPLVLGPKADHAGQDLE